MRDPVYLYKLLPDAPPSPLPRILPTSDLDASSGFIHLSTGPQVLGTLKNFFSSHNTIYLLRIRYVQVQASVKWDSPDGKICGEREPKEGLFAHIYRAEGEGLGLRQEEIDKVGVWTRDGGEWSADGGVLDGWSLEEMMEEN